MIGNIAAHTPQPQPHPRTRLLLAAAHPYTAPPTPTPTSRATKTPDFPIRQSKYTPRLTRRKNRRVSTVRCTLRTDLRDLGPGPSSLEPRASLAAPLPSLCKQQRALPEEPVPTTHIAHGQQIRAWQHRIYLLGGSGASLCSCLCPALASVVFVPLVLS